MTTPIDDTVERRLAPSDPLEVHGMKAGVRDRDHGAFRAAAWVRPADLTDSTLLTVPADDTATVRTPWPEMVHDLVYRTVTARTGADLELRLDLLVPDGDGPFPLVVFVPGGGFVLSPKSGALLRRTAVAERGFVVASIEYRTLRTGIYADAVDDVADAVAFLRRHAGEFRVDPERVALWGESAGGYLAAMAVTTRAVTGVRGVVDVFGLTDLSQVAMDFDDDEQARHHTPEITEAQFVFGRHSGRTIDDDPAEVQRANPVRHVTGGEPPFLLLHGEVDGLVSPGQSQLLHRALLDHGVDSTRLVVAAAGHYGIQWSSATVLDRIIGFLAARLDPDPPGARVRRVTELTGRRVAGWTGRPPTTAPTARVPRRRGARAPREPDGRHARRATRRSRSPARPRRRQRRRQRRRYRHGSGRVTAPTREMGDSGHGRHRHDRRGA